MKRRRFLALGAGLGVASIADGVVGVGQAARQPGQGDQIESLVATVGVGRQEDHRQYGHE